LPRPSSGHRGNTAKLPYFTNHWHSFANLEAEGWSIHNHSYSQEILVPQVLLPRIQSYCGQPVRAKNDILPGRSLRAMQPPTRPTGGTSLSWQHVFVSEKRVSMFGLCSKKVNMLRKFLDRIMCNLMICFKAKCHGSCI
jgi:hypothetical protein